MDAYTSNYHITIQLDGTHYSHSPLPACLSALGCRGRSVPGGGIAQHGHTVLPVACSWSFQPVQIGHKSHKKSV